MNRETRIFNKAFLHWNPSAPLPKLEIHYYAYTTITHTIRLRRGVIKVRISHLFKDAPNAVIESVAHILFSKLYQHRTSAEALTCYHHFVESNQHCFRILLAGRSRPPAEAAPAAGRHHNLHEIFDRANHRYFHPPLSRPLLRWSRGNGQTRLGEYQSLRHAIIINRRFDSPATPVFVLEYLMYHEMLHMKHRAEVRNGRRVVHTPSFRLEEKRFKDFVRAKEWIRRMTQHRDWKMRSANF